MNYVDHKIYLGVVIKIQNVIPIKTEWFIDALVLYYPLGCSRYFMDTVECGWKS